jgi:hypothetical protein
MKNSQAVKTATRFTGDQLCAMVAAMAVSRYGCVLGWFFCAQDVSCGQQLIIQLCISCGLGRYTARAFLTTCASSPFTFADESSDIGRGQRHGAIFNRACAGARTSVRSNVRSPAASPQIHRLTSYEHCCGLKSALRRDRPAFDFVGVFWGKAVQCRGSMNR